MKKKQAKERFEPSPAESPRDISVREFAKETLEREGELEIDSDAVVSEGDDNGAYVQAWVWVDFSGTRFDKVECAECFADLRERGGHAEGCVTAREGR